MKIELATIICSKQEIPWLDFGLESILDQTKHDINTTLYLARYTDEMFEDCGKVCDKYGINFEARGDNYPIGYVNEAKHNGFDIVNSYGKEYSELKGTTLIGTNSLHYPWIQRGLSNIMMKLYLKKFSKKQSFVQCVALIIVQ